MHYCTQLQSMPGTSKQLEVSLCNDAHPENVYSLIVVQKGR